MIGEEKQTQMLLNSARIVTNCIDGCENDVICKLWSLLSPQLHQTKHFVF